MACESEAELYLRLGLTPVPPELRGDGQELEAAARGELPALVREEDLRGDLHVHTDWSDGTASLEEMVAAARRRGHQYVAICDHSRSLRVAGGLSVERLAQQSAAIARCQAREPGIRVLAGTEVDILPDGSLDYPDEVLATRDVVVASIHTGFRQDRRRLTDRLEAAMKNPHVDIVGHPTGRKVLQREPYDVDIEHLIDVAARTGTALEINSSPARLDLCARYARWARDAGAWLAINSDAHSVAELDHLRYGVTVARRAWCETRHVLNALPLEELARRLGFDPHPGAGPPDSD